MDISPLRPESIEMKVMTARDAKNHFGEFLDSARREPVVITKNDRPVGIMISLEDAKDTLFADFLMEQEPEYGDWLFGKVTKTMGRVADGTTGLTEHSDAMAAMRERLQARVAKSA
jgi:prevent-host-death family protein